MADQYTFKWVRIRTRHSSGFGNWEFREVSVPAKLTKPSKKAELDEWFRENLAPEINDELSTMSEHWRGIDWDWSPLPRHFMENRIKNLKYRLKSIRVQIKRYEQQLPDLPEQTSVEGNKRRCKNFPDCGCIKQFKMEDCREPNEWQLQYLLRRDAERAKS
jgi:hypothetical protein